MSHTTATLSAPSPTDPEARTCPWASSVDPLMEKPLSTLEGDAKPTSPLECTYDLLAYQAARNPDFACLGWRPRLAPGAQPPAPGADPDSSRPYNWWTYRETLKRATQFGKGLLQAFGLSRGDRVGVYARNCPWWTLAMIACTSQGIVLVPIYDTLGPNIVEYVCNHAELKVLVTTADHSERVRSALGNCPSVTGVIFIELDGADDPSADTAEQINLVNQAFPQVSTVSAGDVLKAGVNATTAEHATPGTWDELYVIMYTSGTTGNPKGVMLNNSAVMASVQNAYRFFAHHGQEFKPSDSILSYLPLGHIFEQQVEAMSIGCGGRIGFFTGDIKFLLDDLMALKPTLFAGVPRVFARFQERINHSVENASFIQRKLFEIAYNRQLRAEQHPVGPGRISRSALWDLLVFKKVRSRLLPNCRLVITGSAPMSPQTNDFLKVCLQCPVVQGYGLTETVGGLICSAPGASVSGTCGGPLPGSLVKLVDVPDMGYTSKDSPYPRGEICLKGTVVSNGYYKNETATAEAFDADGYFHTGDIGQWLDDGALQIIDRKKNLFKLSQGEYVSPENLEQEYGKCKLVAQIFVYGNSLHNSLLAVVVPDIPASKQWASFHGGDSQDIASIAAMPGFKEELLKQLSEMRAIAKFKRYEEIKDVIIETSYLNDLGQGFHIDNDLMTPSFKLKRPQLNKRYKDRLDELYAKTG